MAAIFDRSATDVAIGNVKVSMASLTRNFTRTHRTIFLVMWGVFAALTFTVTAMNVPHGPDGYGEVVLATIGTLAGPMPGALSRGCQSCCLRFSLGLLPYAGLGLLIAVVPQFVPWPPGRIGHWVRLTLWSFGLLIWFGSGIVSFGHALS